MRKKGRKGRKKEVENVKKRLTKEARRFEKGLARLIKT